MLAQPCGRVQQKKTGWHQASPDKDSLQQGQAAGSDADRIRACVVAAFGSYHAMQLTCHQRA